MFVKRVGWFTMARSCVALCCIALALAMISGSAISVGAASPAEVDTLLLTSNYWDLYPRRSDIALRTFKQLTDVPGVLLVLRTDVKDFSHYLYTVRRDTLPAGEPQVNRSGEIAVRFEDRGEAKAQRIYTDIWTVSASAEESKPYTVEIGYYPKELYAAGGQTSPSWLVVQNTDLLLAGSSVDDYVMLTPTDEDRAYARQRWGDVVKGLDTDHEKSQAIARDLIKILRPHAGVPSDQMLNTSGFGQLARAEKGIDHVWCSNYADIFTQACVSLDIPVRSINMQYFWSSVGDTNFEIAEGHRTTEVFDRGLNRWVWIDLTFGIQGAFYEGQDPLNMAELVRALNDGSRIDALKVVEFDHEKGVEVTVPVLESSKKKSLLNYFRQDQQYRYTRKSSDDAEAKAPSGVVP